MWANKIQIARGTMRQVRTTKKRFGRCTPHESTNADSCTVVIRNHDAEHEHAWLHVGELGIFVRYANESGSTVVEALHYCKPQRESRTVTWSKRKLIVDGSGFHGDGDVETTTDVIAADSPELCDAYDAWEAEYVELRKLVVAVWDCYCVQSSPARPCRL